MGQRDFGRLSCERVGEREPQMRQRDFGRLSCEMVGRENHRRDKEILGDCPVRWWGERTTEGTERFWEIVL